MTKILVTPRSLKSGSDHALNLLTKAGYDVIFSIHGFSQANPIWLNYYQCLWVI